MEQNEKTPSPQELKAADIRRKDSLLMASSKMFEYWGKAGEFVGRLRQKYPDDFGNYELFHIIAHTDKSIEPKIVTTKFDFEGEDSIERFIDRCYDELLRPKENNKAKE